MPPRPGSPGAALWDPEAIPAATVVPLRDGPDGLEVLMVRRDRDLTFAGGMWVFPGGRIDPEDHAEGADPAEAGPDEVEAAARNAALRETTEEAGIVLEPATLRRWSHWTPPTADSAAAPTRRFTTAFFVGVAIGDTDEVTIDDGEIREYRWVRPEDMIEAQDRGEVSLSPPTYITLCQLLGHRNPAEVLMSAPGRLDEVEHFATRVGAVEGGWVALYHGDVAYEEGDVDAEGPRHRLEMGERWQYVRTTPVPGSHGRPRDH
jgi:8-oxo-dGTP pyrophosphatase MutT (NUDIX family)